MKNQPSASIEALLDKGDECTVDDLLEDDDIIQEMRGMSDRLNKFWNREHLKTLFDYITVVPEEDEHKRGHKFPFVASELFALENPQINDKFFNEEEEEI